MRKEDLFKAIGLVPAKYLEECENAKFFSFHTYRKPALVFATTLVLGLFGLYISRGIRAPLPPAPPATDVPVTTDPGNITDTQEPERIRVPYNKPQQYAVPTAIYGAAGAGDAELFYHVSYYEGPLYSLYLGEKDSEIKVSRDVFMNDSTYQGVSVSSQDAFYSWQNAYYGTPSLEEEQAILEELDAYYPEGKTYTIVSPRIVLSECYTMWNLGEPKEIILYYPFLSTFSDLEKNRPELTIEDCYDYESFTLADGNEQLLVTEIDDLDFRNAVPVDQFTDDGEEHLFWLREETKIYYLMRIRVDYGKYALEAYEAGSDEYRILNNGNLEIAELMVDLPDLRELNFDLGEAIGDGVIDRKAQVYAFPADREEIRFRFWK